MKCAYQLFCDGELVTLLGGEGLIHQRGLVEDVARLHCGNQLKKLSPRAQQLRLQRSEGIDFKDFKEQPDGSLKLFIWGFSLLAIDTANRKS